MRAKTLKALTASLFVAGLLSVAQADLAGRINEIISQPSLKKVGFAVHIVKADTGQTVYSRNHHQPMVPASNMKLIVTAAALDLLGPAYRYKTRVGLCGRTLVITGSGDPLLGDEKTDNKYGRQAGWILEDIADKLKQKGITDLDGIVVDTTIFDDQRVHPAWPGDELNKWYACEVSGLNYNGNCIEMTVEKVGNNVIVSTRPPTDFVKITNRATPVKSGNQAVGAYRDPAKPNHLIVKGKCRTRQGPFDVAIERPAALFGFLLAEELTARGISAKRTLLASPPEPDCDFLMLAEYTTAITDCIARCNKDSFALAAESLLKTIAANADPSGKAGSWAGGRKIIADFLLRIGADKNEFQIDDASGLSRNNRLSASTITTVLLYMYRSQNWPVYRDSLAVGGEDGTIARHFKQEKYDRKIFGKTGYIAGVKSFSGLCQTSTGDYLFSILTENNSYTREPVNDIARAIIDTYDL